MFNHKITPRNPHLLEDLLEHSAYLVSHSFHLDFLPPNCYSKPTKISCKAARHLQDFFMSPFPSQNAQYFPFATNETHYTLPPWLHSPYGKIPHIQQPSLSL